MAKHDLKLSAHRWFQRDQQEANAKHKFLPIWKRNFWKKVYKMPNFVEIFLYEITKIVNAISPDNKSLFKATCCCCCFCCLVCNTCWGAGDNAPLSSSFSLLISCALKCPYMAKRLFAASDGTNAWPKAAKPRAMAAKIWRSVVVVELVVAEFAATWNREIDEYDSKWVALGKLGFDANWAWDAEEFWWWLRFEAKEEPVALFEAVVWREKGGLGQAAKRRRLSKRHGESSSIKE